MSSLVESVTFVYEHDYVFLILLYVNVIMEEVREQQLSESIDATHRVKGQVRELLKPQPFDLQSYQLDVDTPDSILAVGYGTLRKEYPLELVMFERRAPLPNDVVIKIIYCGVCHSDWHVNKDEWKNSKYPIITGHEIVGEVVKVGSNSNTFGFKFRVGDIVGLGPNYNSCESCLQCEKGFEQYCENEVTETYNMPDRLPGELKATGPITQGGYSNVIVVDERFVIRIPSGAPLDRVAPILCAGATMWTPLKYMGITSGHRVGIAGYGGLGNIGAKIAKSTGAEVIVITTTADKFDDAAEVSYDVLLAWDRQSLEKYKETFDLIICTIPFPHDSTPYMELIKPLGTMWIVGVMMPMSVDFDRLCRRGKIIRGSSTAGIADTQECMDYCVSKNIYPDVTVISPHDLNATRERIVNKEVRYRYVVDMTML